MVARDSHLRNALLVTADIHERCRRGMCRYSHSRLMTERQYPCCTPRFASQIARDRKRGSAGSDAQCLGPLTRFQSLWRIRHFYVTKFGIPPRKTGTYTKERAWPWGPSLFKFAFWLPIMAGGPLRARPRPSLRCGHSRRSCRFAGNCAPGPCTSRPLRRPKSQLPEGKPNRRPPGRLTHTERFIMTDTPSTEAPNAGIEHGTLEHLDPTLLDVGDNVRDDAALSKGFIASIAELGVLVPITGVRDPERSEVVRVRNGQRRTLAAREAGLASVPVYVLPTRSTAADANQETIDRIVHQIVTNDQKEDLTDAQRARGIQQMIDTGMSVTRAAKKLSVAKDTIKAAETAAKSNDRDGRAGQRPAQPRGSSGDHRI